MPAAQLFLGLLGTGAFASILLASGSRLRRLLAVPVWSPLRFPVDFVVGSWLYAILALLLGLLHAWHWASLGGLALCLGAIGRFRRAGWRWGPALPAAVAGLIVLPVALVTPFFYDALVYHLALPWQALQEHGLVPHPEDLFAAFPPLVQLIDAPLVATGLDRSPALLHWFGFVGAGAGLWGLSRALGAPRWAAGLAGGCLPLLPCLVLVPGLPAAEAWCVAAAIAAFALIAQRRCPPGTEALVGLLAGIAAAARLQGLPWSFVIIGAAFLRTPSLRSVWLSIGGWLAGSAPWWLKNLVLLHDPTAPLAWHREGMESLWRDAGSNLHGAGGAGQLLQLTLAALAPHAAYLSVLILAAVLAATVRAGSRDRIVALAALAGVAAWGVTGTLPRFLAITVALLVAMAASAGGRSRAGRWVSALALGATAAIATAVSISEVVRWRVVAAAIGEPDSVRGELVVNNPFPAFAMARNLPEGARVLFVGEPRGFGFPRRFVAPSQHDVSPLRSVLETSGSPAEACQRLRQQGFTHLLVNWGELGRLAHGYPVAPWRDPTGWRRWNTFIASLGPPALDAKGVQVFVLPAQSGP